MASATPKGYWQSQQNGDLPTQEKAKDFSDFLVSEDEEVPQKKLVTFEETPKADYLGETATFKPQLIKLGTFMELEKKESVETKFKPFGKPNGISKI